MRTKPHLTWREYSYLMSLDRIAAENIIRQMTIELVVRASAFPPYEPPQMQQFCERQLNLEPGYIHRDAWRVQGEWRYPEPRPKPSLFRRALNLWNKINLNKKKSRKRSLGREA